MALAEFFVKVIDISVVVIQDCEIPLFLNLGAPASTKTLALLLRKFPLRPPSLCPMGMREVILLVLEHAPVDVRAALADLLHDVASTPSRGLPPPIASPIPTFSARLRLRFCS